MIPVRFGVGRYTWAVRLSVFTPSHRTKYLDDCYRSLAAQTLADWEWVVLLNGDAGHWAPPQADPRVRVLRAPDVRGVGPAKAAACALATGDVLVELDHDDQLSTDCLAVLRSTFAEHPEAVLVHSDWADINADGSPSEHRYDYSVGWEYVDAEVDGRNVHVCRGLIASPHNMGYVWYAPNHVRAFRREAYDRVGGIDPTFTVADDHKLMIRLFLEGDFVKVPRCLYFQRRHEGNTQWNPRLNAEIQQQTVHLYRQSISVLTRVWCRRNRLAEVTLRARGALPSEVQPVGVVVEVDPDSPSIPLPDSSVGALHLYDVLQHVSAPGPFFNECYRVLAHAGLCFSETPSTEGRGGFQNPSHRSYWNENSFWYIVDPVLRAAVPGLDARFQISQVRTWHPTPWHASRQMGYVQANLIALKDGPRQGGPLGAT